MMFGRASWAAVSSWLATVSAASAVRTAAAISLPRSSSAGRSVGRSLADGPAEGLLLGAQGIAGGNGRASLDVGGEQSVDGPRVGAARLLRGADQVRVVTKYAQVDHALSLMGIDAPGSLVPPGRMVTCLW